MNYNENSASVNNPAAAGLYYNVCCTDAGAPSVRTAKSFTFLCAAITGGEHMEQHSVTYEQYCCVLQRNIVFEETFFHNGTRRVYCTYYPECRRSGGCKNNIFHPILSKVGAGN
ncbi:MAG: hypothetical protein IJK40_03040 [Clostridia bacterium]|nr:hypothetical protein [Clostridia bacterium]